MHPWWISNRPPAMGISVHNAVLKRDNSTRNGRSSPWARAPAHASMVDMPRNRFIDFHRTAERAGYPALLIVSMVCLALVVLPVALLGLTTAVWVLAVALLSLIAAVVILAAAMDAAMADADEPAQARTRADAAFTPKESDSITSLAPRQAAAPHSTPDRRAA